MAEFVKIVPRPATENILLGLKKIILLILFDCDDELYLKGVKGTFLISGDI